MLFVGAQAVRWVEGNTAALKRPGVVDRPESTSVAGVQRDSPGTWEALPSPRPEVAALEESSTLLTRRG